MPDERDREQAGDPGAASYHGALPRDLDASEETETVEEPHRRLLLVSLPGLVVAVPADAVVEVLPARAYARIPGAPDAVAGVVNRRGRMLTVVDLGVALAGEGATVAEDHRIVVVRYQGQEIGMAVRDVLQFASDWWTEPASGGEEPRRSDAAAESGVAPAPESSGEEQLRVIDVETMLAPLFGGGDNGVGEPTEGKS